MRWKSYKWGDVRNRWKFLWYPQKDMNGMIRFWEWAYISEERRLDYWAFRQFLDPPNGA